jgi:GDPmannose 4,6-dehydratase
VVKAAVRIKKGLQNKLYLGNLDSKRDWGYAKEYMYWIWKIMQHPEPTDFVIATGENHTVQEFVEETFKYLDLTWEDYVEIDKEFLRPAEVDILIGDYSKAKNLLGYEPKTKFKDLIKIMVEAELNETTI